jgi:sugar O-acyltransferase (sialic acid O-acetyltransferase NeuD family)
MKRLAIIGSGDLGQLIAHHAISDNQYELVGFFDDYRNYGEEVGLGTVLGKINEVEQVFATGKFDCLMIGIGYKHPDFRKDCFERFSGKIAIGKLVHSSCYVDPSVIIGAGSCLLPGCVLDWRVVVEENVLLNTGCKIAHDTRIGSHSFLGPGVVLAGFIVVGEGSFIGVGTIIVDNISIAPRTQTGGGAVITRNIVDAGLYVGVPAKRVR